MQHQEVFIAEAQNDIGYRLHGERTSIAELTDYLIRKHKMKIVPLPSANTSLIILPDGGDRPRIKDGTNGVNLKKVSIIPLQKVLREEEEEGEDEDDDEEDDEDYQSDETSEEDEEEDGDDEYSGDEKPKTTAKKSSKPSSKPPPPSSVLPVPNGKNYREEVKKKMGISTTKPAPTSPAPEPKKPARVVKKRSEKPKKDEVVVPKVECKKLVVWVASDGKKTGYQLTDREKNIIAPFTRIQTNKFLEEVLGTTVLKKAAKTVEVVVIPEGTNLEGAYAFERKILPDSVTFRTLTEFVKEWYPQYFQKDDWHTKLLSLPWMEIKKKKKPTKPPKTSQPSLIGECKKEITIIDCDNPYLFISDPVYTCSKDAKVSSTYSTFDDFLKTTQGCDSVQLYNWPKAQKRIGALVKTGKGSSSWALTIERDPDGNLNSLSLRRAPPATSTTPASNK